MLLQSLIFAFGLVVLTIGADVFIRGASGLGERFGLSQFVIGLVIVGFGTSAPELAVNLSAVLGNHPDIAMGNVVGSNIANIGLILGVTAMVAPIAVQLRMIRVEVPILIAASVLLWVMALDGSLGTVEGIVLLLGQAGVMVIVLRSSKSVRVAARSEIVAPIKKPPSWTKTIVCLVLGLSGLVWGGMLAVDSAVSIARTMGISELVIGLTVVAIGTSLPELASSAVAGFRGQGEIAIGNVVGSNLFNILFVLGLSASISEVPVNESLIAVELPVMILFTIALLPLMRRKLSVSRADGMLLFVAYLALIGYQVWMSLRVPLS